MTSRGKKFIRLNSLNSRTKFGGGPLVIILLILIFLFYFRQVFVMYNALPDPNMKTMVDIIDKAISLVASIYIIVSRNQLSLFLGLVWDKVFKSGPSKVFRTQPLYF